MLPNSNHLTIGRPGRYRFIRATNGLPSGTTNAVQAADGTIWTAGSQGLFRIALPFRFEFWSRGQGMLEVMTILRTGNRMYAGGDGGLVLQSPGRDRWLPTVDSAKLRFVTHLIPGAKQTLFAGLYYGSVAQLRGDGSVLRKADDTDRASGMRLVRTPDGRIWLAGRGMEEVRVQGDRLALDRQLWPGEQRMGLDAEVDDNGTLWACYAGGLARRVLSGWQFVAREHGLRQSECRAFAVDPSGQAWYGYNTVDGFSRVQVNGNGTVAVHHFQSGSGTGQARVHFLDLDGRKRLWRGGPDGVYVSSPAEAGRGRWLHLGKQEGFPSVAMNQQSFYPDTDGSVWFGADDYLMHYQPPDDLMQPKQAPSLFVSAISANGGAPMQAESARSVAGDAVTMHFGSLQVDRRSNLRVRYRRRGHDPDWRYTNEVDVPLGRMSPGVHVIEAQAQLGSSGPWSGVVAHQLRILPPVWLSAPALFSYLFGGGLASAALAASTVRRRKRRRELPDLSEWRRDVLVSDQDGLAGFVLDGRFAVGCLLARGGFATVYQGQDLAAGSPCAVKVFRNDVGDEVWRLHRFEQEVSALERVCHPHIVRICGHGVIEGGTPYLAMEFIEGTVLRAVLDEGGLSLRRVARLTRQAGLALAALHERGIYHRDVKPENLMLRAPASEDESLVLIDFSIALVKDPGQTLHGLTRAAGSLAYMAPEQAIGYADSSTDLYSLAKVIVEMLTGESVADLLPQPSLDLTEQLNRLLTQRLPQLDSAAVKLLSSALAFDPARRPRDARDFTESLARAIERCASYRLS